tara:strand:- start:25094 stop:25747 length:654 start_codon:yes stop_codon:yes gene_type:complete
MITTFLRWTRHLLAAALFCTLAFTTIARAVDMSPPKILVIVSSESTLHLQDGKTYPTGYYLNELTVPVRKLMDRGYEVVFANPAGNAAAMDKRSDSADHFGNDPEIYESYRQFHDGLAGLKSPERLSAVIEKGLDPYAGYKMTIFSTAEEQVAEATALGGKVRFYPDVALIAADGKVEPGELWSPHVVEDRELITGQNPGSDILLSEALVNAIEANR